MATQRPAARYLISRVGRQRPSPAFSDSSRLYTTCFALKDFLLTFPQPERALGDFITDFIFVLTFLGSYHDKRNAQRYPKLHSNFYMQDTSSFHILYCIYLPTAMLVRGPLMYHIPSLSSFVCTIQQQCS